MGSVTCKCTELLYDNKAVDLESKPKKKNSDKLGK